MTQKNKFYQRRQHKSVHVKSTLVVEGNDERVSYAMIKQSIKGDYT
jgi:hypothetical protein